MRRGSVFAAAVLVSALGQGVAAAAARPVPPVITSLHETRHVLPSGGGVVRVVARLRRGVTCQVQLVSHPPLRVSFPHASRSCRGGALVEKVSLGANAESARRPVMFALIVRAGRQIARRRFLVLVDGVTTKRVASRPLTPTTTPQTSTTGTPSAATPPAVDTPRWAGYTASSSSVIPQVGADWTVPTLTCAPGENSVSAAWIGNSWPNLSTDQLVQIGTADDCADGVPYYRAFWEFYPVGNAQFFSMSVSAGDQITASISDSGGTWTAVVTDVTTGMTGVSVIGGNWGVEATGSSTLQIEGSTAGESYAGGKDVVWTAEMPSYGGQPLADYGTVTFTHVEAANGVTLAGATPMIMVSGGTTLSTVSPPGGDSFTATYQAS